MNSSVSVDGPTNEGFQLLQPTNMKATPHPLLDISNKCRAADGPGPPGSAGGLYNVVDTESKSKFKDENC